MLNQGLRILERKSWRCPVLTRLASCGKPRRNKFMDMLGAAVFTEGNPNFQLQPIANYSYKFSLRS